MSTTENPSQTGAIERDVHSLIENLVTIGATWARYGLTVGREALQTSAKTLSASADFLSELSKQLEHEPPRPGSGPNA